MLLKYAIELMQNQNYIALWLVESAEDIEKKLRLMALSKLKDNYKLDIIGVKNIADAIKYVGLWHISRKRSDYKKWRNRKEMKTF